MQWLPDETLSAAERMEAERHRADVVFILAKIEVEGPRIVDTTLRRFYDRLEKQQQQQFHLTLP